MLPTPAQFRCGWLDVLAARGDLPNGLAQVPDERQPLPMARLCEEVCLEPPSILVREGAADVRVDQVVRGRKQFFIEAVLSEQSFLHPTLFGFRQPPEQVIDQRLLVGMAWIHRPTFFLVPSGIDALPSRALRQSFKQAASCSRMR